MARIITISSLLVLTALLNSCASGYKKINPDTINYASRNIEKNILLEYKYDLLDKKYKKKETKNNIKLVAVKITNKTDRDILLGRDFKLVYENGNEVILIETEKLFKTVKQSPTSYLWYLLLSPVQIFSGTNTTTNNGYTESKPGNSFPIGLIVGPGLAGGNIIVANSANKNFKNELRQFDIQNKIILKGETVYGLIGTKYDSYDSITIKMR